MPARHPIDEDRIAAYRKLMEYRWGPDLADVHCYLCDESGPVRQYRSRPQLVGCSHCRRGFSVLGQTPLQNCKLGPERILAGIEALVEHKAITCSDLAELLHCTRTTAWTFQHRLRACLSTLRTLDPPVTAGAVRVAGRMPPHHAVPLPDGAPAILAPMPQPLWYSMLIGVVEGDDGNVEYLLENLLGYNLRFLASTRVSQPTTAKVEISHGPALELPRLVKVHRGLSNRWGQRYLDTWAHFPTSVEAWVRRLGDGPAVTFDQLRPGSGVLDETSVPDHPRQTERWCGWNGTKSDNLELELDPAIVLASQ